MSKVKYTELTIINSQLKEGDSIEGDHNLAVFAFDAYIKRYYRKSDTYCYRVEHSEFGTSYRYNLTTSEFNQFKKLIPDFK